METNNDFRHKTYTNPGPSDTEGCGCPIVLLITGIVIILLIL